VFCLSWSSPTVNNAQYTPPMPTRLNCRVKLCRVGSVNAPIGSRDPVCNFLCCWAIEVGDKWRHNDIIDEKVINIDQNSRTQTAMFSFQIVDRIRRQSSWAIASYVHTADATQLDSCVASASAVCIGLNTLSIDVKSPAAHAYRPYTAISVPDLPFDHRMMPWKCCDDRYL